MAITNLAIERYRGDTYPIAIALTNKSTGAVTNITDCSFELHCKDLFNSTGSITDAPNGKVSFPVTADNADNVGKYKFDVQMTDATGYIRTIAIGTVIFKQDVE